MFPYWERQWKYGAWEDTYKNYITFLALVTARCTVYFPLNKYRIAIPPELRARLSHCGALCFRVHRTGDMELRKFVKRWRGILKTELDDYLLNKLKRSLATRYSSSPSSVAFWSKTKRFFKSANASLHHAFIISSGEITSETEKMADTAADYYEKLYSAPTIHRPHPYEDAPKPTWDNEEEEIPVVTVEEVIKVVQSREKKHSVDIDVLFPTILILDTVHVIVYRLVCVMFPPDTVGRRAHNPTCKKRSRSAQ